MIKREHRFRFRRQSERWRFGETWFGDLKGYRRSFCVLFIAILSKQSL